MPRPPIHPLVTAALAEIPRPEAWIRDVTFHLGGPQPMVPRKDISYHNRIDIS